MMFKTLRKWTLLATALLTMSLAGCDEDPMRRGQAALLAENAEAAEESFEKVLASDPNNLEAKRMMAEVYRLKGQHAQAEEQLLSMWTDRGFDDESKELTPEDKSLRGRISQQLRELYVDWAESLDGAEEPELFEEVVAKGLERHSKNARLNSLAVEHFMARGERLVEEGEKLEAAELFERVLEHRAMPQQRDAARDKAKNLRLEVFSEDVKKRFESDVKAGLVEQELWDEENESLRVEVEVDVDRSLRAGNEEDMQRARAQARPAVALALGGAVALLTGVEITGEDMQKAGWPKHKLASEELRRGKYTVLAQVALDEATAYGFEVAEAQRKAKSEDSDTESPEDEEEASEDSEEDPAEEDADGEDDSAADE